MSVYLQDISDKLGLLVQDTKSSRSVARAYKQYLADKTLIMSKVLSAIASATVVEVTTVRSNPIDNILNDAGLEYDNPVFTSNGGITKIGDMLSTIIEEGLESGPTGITPFGTNYNVNETIDNLVESFQASKVIESAFSVLEETEEGFSAGFANITARVNSLGMDLTTSGQNMLTAVGDVMSDATGSVVDKISVIGDMVSAGMDRITESDNVTKVDIPEFGEGGYDAVPPVNSMLQSIKIDWTKPLDVLLIGVKAQVAVSVGFFKLAKKVVTFGWNKTSKYVSDTFIDPVDFQLVNIKSKSHIVDVPIIDQILHIGHILTSQYSDMMRNAKQAIYDMPIGSMKSAYTPFGVINVVKIDAEQVRVLVHVIPSQPLLAKHVEDTDFGYSTGPIYVLDGDNEVVSRYESDGINSSLTGVFDRYIFSDQNDKFEHDGDDDGYYLSAVAVSMFRLQNITSLAYMLYHGGVLRNHGIDNITMSEAYNTNREVGMYVDWPVIVGAKYVWEGSHETKDPTWLQLSERPKLYEALKNQFSGNAVTNKDFYDMMSFKNQTMEEDAFIYDPLFATVFLNDYSVMEEYVKEEPDVPPFMPSVYENTYQEPMYEISTDGKNGAKVTKFFKGLAIVAAVAVAGVIAGKAVLKLKQSLRIQSLQLNSMQRAFESLDPNDPSYMDKYREYNTARKKFSNKNKFLSFIGMGINKTATGSISSGIIPESFIPSSKETINEINILKSIIK